MLIINAKMALWHSVATVYSLTALILTTEITCSSAQTSCGFGALRLVGGTTPREGRVEVCLNSVWGTVCDDLWGVPDAQVICRQLGYTTIGVQYYRNAYFGEGTGPIHLDNVNCAGNESSLLNCTLLTNHNCIHSEDAGVECAEACPTEGMARLVGGLYDYEGRVEICTSGIWSTVCDDYWGSVDAQVLCNQLGYSTEGALAFSTAFFGEGKGLIFLDNFHCIGSEVSLLNCKHLNQSNCDHSADAGVRCQVGNTSCLDGDLRLVNGQTQFEGRVEICLNNTWGTVCDDSWSSNDARVVCRQLGYGTENVVSFSDAYFGQGTGPIHIDNVGCSGSESVLVQCNHLTINNCVHAEDAGVRCSPPDNCTEGDIRLVGGQDPNEGRVEICLEGQWGTVCDDYFDSVDAQVACRQLGYATTGALSFSYHYFGYGSGPIHFKNVHCTGDEESVLQCSHNTINTYCSHYEDAGIACPQTCDVEGAVRLTGESHAGVGRLDYCSGGLWGTACPYTLVASSASVVCRQLGFSSLGLQLFYNGGYVYRAGPSYTFSCFGNETTLDNCTVTSAPSYCNGYSQISIRCAELCSSEGQMRLSGGENNQEGTVDICIGGVWGTVCDDFWGSLDAQVVCRQLGYTANGALAFSSAYFGQGSGPILIDNAHCSGSESSLLDCNHLNQSNCVHTADAGVRCNVNNSTCLEDSIRLINGQNQFEGRVEICQNNTWGTVCDDSWFSIDARVVCRQLGYGTYGATSFSNAYFGQGTGPIHIDNVGCSGSESVLVQCNHLTIDDCVHAEDAGVRCNPPDNCTEGELRLVGGQTHNEGRVEICLEGEWGTVCDDYWGSVDAQVACRQLGYVNSTGAIAFTNAKFGQGNGPIHFRYISCTGSEHSLLQCSIGTSSYCSHYEDAGIRCQANCDMEAAVRLVDGQNNAEGRVEYCSGGVWGTVCDNTWDAMDAAVVCRQLGYTTVGATPLYNAVFSQGAGPVVINTIVCNGNETDINNCTLTTPSTCSHYNDASVRCSENCIIEGALRLVGEQINSQGTVQICIGGVWGTVCDDGWGTSDAQVVCRQLGFITTGVQAYSSAYFGQGSGPIQLDDVNCIGNETSLLNCTHLTTHNCGHQEDAGVACPDLCTSDGSVRLVGGMYNYEGRVEICFNGIWSTVCDDFWGSLDAQVVCNQLGYSTEGALAFSTAYFGQGVGPISLDNVHCSGSESSLLDCNHLNQSNCLHSADAGVRCQVANTTCLEGDLRLVNGQSQFEGRVEICLNNVWGTVCDDSWYSSDARVVCRQLGYGTEIAISFSNAYFGQGTGPIHIDNVGCSGSESVLVQCNHLTIDNCVHAEDAGVRCSPPSNCTEGELRLVGGQSPNEGRVEICLEGQWGTVCDDYWGSVDAQVACRQLGYSSAGALSFTYAFFGQGTGTIHLRNVHCIGSESSLIQCSHNTFYNYCGHYEDAGIRCQEQCSVEAAVRLVGGQNSAEGRVEYCSGGVWGTVCDNTWDAMDAAVVCRQLGYPAIGATPLFNSVFGQGAGTVVINTIVCNGNETNISNCTLTTPSTCSHYHDASVRCSETCIIEGALRLVGGQSYLQGTVQVCMGGLWGTICGNNWGTTEGQVVCRELGFSTNGVQVYYYAHFGQGGGPIHFNNFGCIGSESSLFNCTHSTTNNCGHYQDAGVTCSAELCTSDGSIRLVGGMYDYEGRVEICTNGGWSTVCDDFWGSVDAQVVCNQLGYSTEGALAFSTAYFGQGIGTVLFDNVHCNGSELALLNCIHHNQSNCAHSADAGVRCQVTNATTCLEGDLRLVNGQSQFEGRVEICLNNVWGTVCDDSWYSSDARVVCRQLGYGTENVISFSNAYFGQGNGPIHIDNVGCSGSESVLVQCNHLTIDNCVHAEDAGVRCSPPSNCTEGELRLIGGQSPNEGRVEICLEGQWGTVCDDYWGSVDAQVACRQLGYSSTGALSFTYSYFGQGSGSIHIRNVHCSGSEPSLIQCSHNSIYNNYCYHYEDAGLVCPQSCSAEGAVRLTGGPRDGVGRVEYCSGGLWGTTCGNTFVASSASVACRQLGYSSLGAVIISVTQFGYGAGPMYSFSCYGNETGLDNCTVTSAASCSYSYQAAVRCAEHCTSEGQMRLTGGENNQEGTVEICFGGVWGTVCDDFWGLMDAQVVCRQLGYTTNGALAFSSAHFGQGIGPISFDNVHCDGNEFSLLDCKYLNQSNCAHSADAGVRCQGSNTTCLEGDVRLVNGQNQFEGRVEICLNSVWGTVCDDSWSSSDARVVCRQLGYGTENVISFSNAYFGQGTGPIQIDNVGCSGSESVLVQCNHLTIDNCVHAEDAGVRCSPPDNCTEGDLRLIGGQSPHEGRLEVCLDGQWGTVCDDYWNLADALVACKQLGYTNSTGAISFTNAHFGQGTGTIHLRNVHCIGSEPSLIQCSHNTINFYCGHYEDVGIRCQEDCSVEAAVRLVGGQNSAEGRVEYCSGGVWGTVCDNTWDTMDATVVCRQLGYHAGVTPFYNAMFGQGAGPVVINTIVCNGNETNINNCTLTTPSTCSHYNDAGVRCLENCTIEGSVRLVGGQNNFQGTVQICIGGVWGTVCDDSWGTSDAQVVCRQLGFGSIGVQAYSSAYFGQGSGPIQLDDVNCIGTENSLLNCTHLTTHNCGHYEDAGVACQELCTSDGSSRLVGGMYNYEGRVEICTNGGWSTVCDDYWGSVDAQVICNQLGYSTEGALAFSTAYFGQGSGLILIDNVHCSGSESSLLDCNHLNQSNCLHSADAGVRCQGNNDTCLEGDLRLVNGQNDFEGRVEICLNNIWGTVCDDYWSSSDARVVCRQLGYGTYGAISFSNAYFGQGTGLIQIDNVGCSGSESVLVQCNHLTVASCVHAEDAGVRCSPPDDCTEGDLRLVGGQIPNEGRVEVCLEGQWGTVCDDYWGSVDAQVACRQLGYSSTGALSFTYAFFGQGTGTIHLRNVHCIGSESSLIQCSHNTFYNYCGHYEDAGIRCQEQCSVEAAVRLVGGQNSAEGRVEYCSGGVWGTVCDNTWDAMDAVVVCRQLGYPAVGATHLSNAIFGQGAGPVVINTIVCNGNETNINNCTLTTPSTCSHYNDASVRCSENCVIEGDVRLIGGDSVRGTVQVCIKGVWGSVCDQSWGLTDANLVCKQLGHSSSNAASYSNAYFGQSGGPVHITNVECFGNESGLLNCSYSNIVTCSHSDDAGVLCQERCNIEEELRLVGGNNPLEGRVEICQQAAWATVCNSLWNTAEANVVCRQLGYFSAGALAFTGSYFGQGSSDTQLGNFLCNGTEDKLLKCIHSITSCLHSNEAGVRCRGNVTTCTEAQVRLVGGSTYTQGRVEVCSSSGVWGTVCDDGWSTYDARVVCRQLGFSSTGSVAFSNAYYGQGTGPILYDNVGCYGTENVLQQCNHITNHNCGHYEDAGVSCQPQDNCTTGEIRLAGANNPRMGRVEICIDGQWGTICDSSWTASDADVVCRQIGNYSSGAIPRVGAYFGQGSVPVTFDSLTCSGEENSVTKCNFTVGTSCFHSLDVGVQCPETCTVDGSIRLAGGSSDREGTVEVCQEGLWGLVCDDQWDTEDAAVVCRQLGYPFDVNAHYGISQNTTNFLSNFGEEFYFGFMRSYYSYGNFRIVVQAETNVAVPFGVETDSGEIYRGTTTAASPVTILLPTNLSTQDSSYSYRNKGVHVNSIGGGKLSVLAINLQQASTVGGYLAYPCHSVDGSPYYEYYIVSTQSYYYGFDSEFLLVGCEANTMISVTPTQTINIPIDVQSSSSMSATVQRNTNHQITLNKMQTLLVRAADYSSDLTGTRIISNKPLTVISGHECANIPSSQYGPCAHLAEQILPTTTWRQNFLLVPFGGRSGQYYKIMSSKGGTTVARTCNSVTTTQTLSSPGNFSTFFTSSTTYCSVVSNKPIFVTQLGIGGQQDGIGRPVITTVPSLDQYTDRYTFSSLNTSDFTIHQISVSVLPEYYQPNNIKLDGNPLQTNWTAIYNTGGSIVGYGCHVSVTGGASHTVSHDNPSGKMAVLVYGWNSAPFNGYSYLAGLSFRSLQSGNQVALTNSYFGPGTGKFQIGSVQCVGSESSLASCSYNASTDQCMLGSQAGVICPDSSVIITKTGQAIVGSTLNLICAFTGDIISQIMLQWKSPNGDIINNSTDVTPTNSDGVSATIMLYFEELAVSDAGQYTCEVLGQSGMNVIMKSRQYSIVLQVPAPSVSVGIDSTSSVLYEGQQLALVCLVNISAVVDTPINVTTSWSGPNGFTSLSIATQVPNTNTYEGRLIITELMLERDNGSTYTCTAELISTNDPVHILSNSDSSELIIIIDVLKGSASDVELFPTTNLTLNENGNLWLSCSSYGYPQPIIHWQRDDTVLVNTAKFQISMAEIPYENYQTLVNSTLQISGLLPSDAGKYVCIASNERGTSRASLSVQVQPYDDCSVSDSLPCGSNGVCIDGLNTFVCTCDDGFDGIPCEPIVMNVTIHPAMITIPPASVKAELYHQVNLTCKATGDSPITYQWERDGQILSGGIFSSLIIPEVNPDHRGAYRCIASNNVNSVTSVPAIVSIRGVHQYVVDASLVEDVTTDVLLEALLGPVLNYNVTIIAVKRYSELTQVPQAAKDDSNISSLLVTIWNNDKNVNSSNIRQILQMSFQNHPISRGLRVEGADIFDACPSQNIPLVPGSNITINWEETEISVKSLEPCPCQSLIKQYGNMITRHCGGSYSQGGVWNSMDYSHCGLTSRTIELCEALHKPPEILAEILVNVTSTPDTLIANEVTAASTVIDQLTLSATKDAQIRENYLESIDNVIDVDQEIIREANASTSILSSLIKFSDNAVLNSSNNDKQTFTRRNYALQIDEIDSEKFIGESLSVDLGTVEEAMNSSGNIDPQALLNRLSPLSNTTGSLTVSEGVVNGDIRGVIRLGFSVFVSSSLFPTVSPNTTVASIILNVRLTHYNISTNDLSLDLFNVTFQTTQPSENMTIVNETCADWDLSSGVGRWTSDSCRMVSKLGERPVMCSCSQPAHFGLLFDLVPSPPLFPEALSAVTYIGLIMSIICLLAIIITYLIEKEIRTQPHNQIIINLSISLLGLYVFFLIGGHVTEVKALCGISAGLLQYFMLVFFSWTAAESVFLFMKLVKVVGGGIPHYTLKAGLLAWILPAIIVVIVGGAGHEFYANRFFCRAEGVPFYIGTILPIVIIFIFNLVMYIFIIVSVCRRLHGAAKSSNTKLSYRKLAWTAVVLSVVFGLGWCFGLAQTSVPQDSGDAARGTLFALQFLFSLLVGSQGVLMFVFYGLTNKKIREVWKKWFIPKRRGKFSLDFSSHSTSTMRGYSRGSTLYSNTYATMQRSQVEKGEMCKESIKETSFDKELEKTDSMFDQKEPAPEISENFYYEPEKIAQEEKFDPDLKEYEDNLDQGPPIEYCSQSDSQKHDSDSEQEIEISKLEENDYAVPDQEKCENIEELEEQKTTTSPSETEEKFFPVVVLKNENAEEADDI